MHPLREAMLDQMRLRGHSPRTQQSYLCAVTVFVSKDVVSIDHAALDSCSFSA